MSEITLTLKNDKGQSKPIAIQFVERATKVSPTNSTGKLFSAQTVAVGGSGVKLTKLPLPSKVTVAEIVSAEGVRKPLVNKRHPKHNIGGAAVPDKSRTIVSHLPIELPAVDSAGIPTGTMISVEISTEVVDGTIQISVKSRDVLAETLSKKGEAAAVAAAAAAAIVDGDGWE